MFFHTPQFDLDLFVLINQTLHSGLLNLPMQLLSSMTALFLILLPLMGWLIWKFGKKQIPLCLLLLLAMGLSDASSGVVKGQVKRVRPLNSVASTWYVEDAQWRQRPEIFSRTKASGTSYPSAHAANTACLALLSMLLWPALKRKQLWVLPLLVGFSRIYLGKHFPTDVLAGWLFGATIAGFVWLTWRLWIKTWLAKNWPSWT